MKIVIHAKVITFHVFLNFHIGQGINPFTGEETVFAARPESRTVKIRALKKLKGFANS